MAPPASLLHQSASFLSGLFRTKLHSTLRHTLIFPFLLQYFINLTTSLLQSFEEGQQSKTLEFTVTSGREGLFFQMCHLFPPPPNPVYCPVWISARSRYGSCPPTLGIINTFPIIDNSPYLMCSCALRRLSVWREKCILIWGIPRFYRGAKL